MTLRGGAQHEKTQHLLVFSPDKDKQNAEKQRFENVVLHKKTVDDNNKLYEHAKWELEKSEQN